MSAVDRGAEQRAALRPQIAAAARIVSPTWPLGTFVAVNPLGGLVNRGFEEAVATGRAALGVRGVPPLAELHRAIAEGRVSHDDLRAAVRRRRPGLDEAGVDAESRRVLAAEDAPPARGPQTAAERCDALLGTSVAATADEETARWCAAFASAAAWPMPGRERGLYRAWRRAARGSVALRRMALPGAAERLAALPESPDDALLAALQTLRVGAAERVDELRGHVARLPGWAAAAQGAPNPAAPLALVDLLAVRAVYEVELLSALAEREVGGPTALRDLLERAAAAHPRRLPADPIPDEALIALEALEGAYADRLLGALDRPPPAPAADRPAAQAVFCIDARSEGLRRRLEEQGAYETLGFAGFFAVAMRFRPLGSERADAQAPVLLDPRAVVTETAPDTAKRRYVDGIASLAGAERSFHAAKDAAPSPFAVAELGGWVSGPLAAARTLAARTHARLRSRAEAAATPAPGAAIDLDGLTLADQELIAHTALTTMGLVQGFGRLVLLCGHGSTTQNNPYAAALQCGACGGHAGAPNARAAATILNRPEVRAALANRGVTIPDDTVFVAGLHDTTTDRVEVLDRHLVPATHADDVTRLVRDLDAAGAAHAAERVRDLPGAAAVADEAVVRSADWAQVRPEWGLARNAAFVVGPRSMTAGLDLGCRTFLHSYDPAADPELTGLETILTAPLVVAQWINAQYFFSTTDPEILGAGDKVVHNVVGDVGVLQGTGGDLQLGLPLQACFAGGRPYHEPLRLLCVVQAPRDDVDALIARNAILRHFFDGGWVGLALREDAHAPWQRRAGGGWVDWRPAAEPLEVPA